ncbi:tape measure protein [Pseudotabrizicola algicola]|uniref:Tape measure protein n=1 Tax=Pseudotabrizicola algicola TaxID=2709381 RepID=A0A6B3RJY1_9RHOB|nr:tape measure protein [Pseudotabrizicola algicola]NEX45453.1 tape measure protein [Pseudotabrizicola algicola]
MAQKRVSVRLVAEGGRQVKAEFQGIGDAGERNFKRIERQADITGTVVRRVMGILGAAISTRQLVAYADQWTDLRSRVDLATGSQEAGAAVMERLATMARRTYSSLGQTTESWLANATALRELGLTTAESLDFTEALNNAMVVSGARAERAASVQTALSRAMALGTLSGDNLNTVIQNGGRLAELLAAELGTTVSGLRRLGQQGGITGEVIRTALIGNLELLREEADSMPATIGDAFTLIGNAALQLVGTWDQMVGASSTLAAALIGLADNMERLAAIGIAFAGFMAARWVAGFVAAQVATISLAGALTLLRGAIIRTGIGALIVGAGELIYWFGQLVRGAGGFGNALSLLGDLAREVWERMKLGAVAMGLAIMASWADIKAAIAEALQTSLQAVVGFGNGALNTFQGALDAIKVLWGALPAAIGDFAFQAANALIAGVEAMLNGVGERINGFLEGINGGLEALGIERRISLIGNLELGRIDNPFAGSATEAGAEARAAFQAAFNAEPITMPDLGLGAYAEEARGQAEALRATMAGVAEAATAPLESIDALRQAVTGSGLGAEAALNGARTAAEGLGESLEATGEAAGRAGGAGRGAGQALREAADTARGAWEATAAAVRAAQERSREIAQGLAQDIVGPIKEALQSGEFTWETFASAISRIAQNLANRLIELAFKPIENALMRAFSGMGGGGGFFASLFGFAKGGAFAGGQELTAFARGGVVNRPTVFPFSRGIGLMGEAGPEAILPLRRGRDGRLGVEMNSTPAQPAQDMSTRIINVLDPSVVGDYLATRSGERAILNVIRRNRSALNA